MNFKKKTVKTIIIGVLILFLLELFGGWILLNLKAWLAAKKMKGVEEYAQTVEQITVPESVEIIALGEAAHGNKEFQELKLSVLQELVENKGVKSFALETDFGEGIAVNAYIHGGTGTAEEAVKQLSFTIYHTQQMIDLITWMREYNDNASNNEKISFYGFDLQNPQMSADYIKSYFDETGAGCGFDVGDTLDPFMEEDIILSNEKTQKAIETLNIMKEELEDKKDLYIENSSMEKYEIIVHCVDNILNCVELFAIDDNDYIMFNNKRDEYMSENVTWILEYEQEKGNTGIMIAGHNGHIAKSGGYYTSMGSNLSEKYGKKYFAIGTDYFKTVDNIANNTDRGNYRFCSADPLAAQAKFIKDEMYYLNFAQIDKESDIYSVIHSNMSMGSLGEGYSIVMKLMNSSHRINQVPSELYDGMVFVYSANPISPFAKD